MPRKTSARIGRRPARDETVGKRIAFDRETWDAVDLLARDQMKDLQELAAEAFADLLEKHGRTADFRKALRMSAQQAKKAKPARAHH